MSRTHKHLRRRKERGGIWYMDYVDASGVRCRESTGTDDLKLADVAPFLAR